MIRIEEKDVSVSCYLKKLNCSFASFDSLNIEDRSCHYNIGSVSGVPKVNRLVSKHFFIKLSIATPSLDKNVASIRTQIFRYSRDTFTFPCLSPFSPRSSPSELILFPFEQTRLIATPRGPAPRRFLLPTRSKNRATVLRATSGVPWPLG